MASIIVLVSILLTWLCETLVPEGHLFSINLASTIIAAGIGGLGPGILASLVEAISVDYFFIGPSHYVFDSPASFIRVFIYVSFGIMTSLVISFLRQAILRESLARKQALRASDARESVLALVSHDLRNPLSSIIMNSCLIKKEAQKLESNSFTRYYENIFRSSQRMNRLIEDLLDAVKVERGKFSIQPTESDLPELIKEAIDSVTLAAKNKDIRLKTEIPSFLPHVLCDHGRILQVLANLLGNAIKFSPVEADVFLKVAIYRQDKELLIQVIDSGPGVSAEEQKQLFDRFWQSQHTAHQGTGLGLFISKAIVEKHGGLIGVESRKDHRGSIFYFTLPLRTMTNTEVA